MCCEVGAVTDGVSSSLQQSYFELNLYALHGLVYKVKTTKTKQEAVTVEERILAVLIKDQQHKQVGSTIPRSLKMLRTANVIFKDNLCDENSGLEKILNTPWTQARDLL